MSSTTPVDAKAKGSTKVKNVKAPGVPPVGEIGKSKLPTAEQLGMKNTTTRPATSTETPARLNVNTGTVNTGTVKGPQAPPGGQANTKPAGTNTKPTEKLKEEGKPPGGANPKPAVTNPKPAGTNTKPTEKLKEEGKPPGGGTNPKPKEGEKPKEGGNPPITNTKPKEGGNPPSGPSGPSDVEVTANGVKYKVTITPVQGGGRKTRKQRKHRKEKKERKQGKERKTRR